MLLQCRQALRYIVRNTTLSSRERAEAHIQLAQMHCYMNPTQIRNRCILGGKGRGIFRDFKMSRVRSFPVSAAASVCVCVCVWAGRGGKRC